MRRGGTIRGPVARGRAAGTGSISIEQAFTHLFALVDELVGYLRTSTSDEQPGEMELKRRAVRALDYYRPALDRMSRTAAPTSEASE